MRPYGPLPIPHFCWLKSSAVEVGIATFAFALVLGRFAFTETLLLRLSLRMFALELLVLVGLRLASPMIMTTRPTPMIRTAARPPRIHHSALDFLRGAAVALAVAGIHCGGGCGGGGGGGAVGRGLTTGGGG